MRNINDPDVKQALLDNAPYGITITVTPVSGTPVTIGLDHVAENGISINPSSVSGNRLELGTVIASAATFVFYDYDGTLSNIAFKGAELYVQGNIEVNGNTETFDIGYFIADTVKEQNKRITVNCFDRMILFDVVAHMASITFPIDVYSLLLRVCTLCGVTLATAAGTLPNNDLYVTNTPTGSPTYRQLLGWAAALMGRCAMINNDGELELKWYGAADWDANPDHRFEGGESAKASITTTGVRSVANGVATYTAGADGYTIDIADNDLLINGNISMLQYGDFTPVSVDALMDNIWNDIGPITYYPVRTDIIHNVVADVFDIADFTELDGAVKSVAVTDVVWNLSAKTAIQSKGESEEEASYAQQNPFTQSQAAAIADAGRLKIGRIESVDETIYYDLDTGEIHTEITEERAVDVYTTYPYNTALDFKDGELDITTKKSGAQVERIEMGVEGIDIQMDSSQPYTLRVPSNWDNMTPVHRAVWLTAQTLLADPYGLSGRINGGITIHENPTATELKQLFEWSGGITEIDFDTSSNAGTRTAVTPGEIDVQDVAFTGNPTYDINHQTKITPTTVNTEKIAAATGMKIGSDDYDDPSALPVATESYVQSYIASLLGDYIESVSTSGIWTIEKWHSGKAICYGLAPMTITSGSMGQVGSLYYKQTTAAFPSSLFVDVPELFTSVHTDDTSNWLWWTAKLTPCTAATAYYTVMRHTNTTTDVDLQINMYAVGRWQ